MPFSTTERPSTHQDRMERHRFAAQLVADANCVAYWILGTEGRERERAGDEGCRKTARYLLREHGWTIDQIDRFRAVYGSKYKHVGAPPDEPSKHEKAGGKGSYDGFGADPYRDHDLRVTETFAMLRREVRDEEPASEACASEWLSNIQTALANLCATMDAKAQYGSTLLREENERAQFQPEEI